MKARLAAVALFTAAVLGLGSTALAGKNWMHDYVEQRLAERMERAVGHAVRQPRIVGGTVAQSTSNRFQVGILFKGQPDNFFAQYCGGTLVKQRFVVTAAHCSDFVTAAQVQVLTGTRRLDGTGVRRNVVGVYIHPKWDPVSFDYDVAVWELASSAPGPFASLATADPAVGTSLLATGWGHNGSFYPIDLMQVSVPLAGRGTCNDANSYNGDITARMLCAGFDAGGKDTCQGDSGGPLTHVESSWGSGRVENLVGITSWGTGCALPNLYGVYTRVSNPSIYHFILAMLE